MGSSEQDTQVRARSVHGFLAAGALVVSVLLCWQGALDAAFVLDDHLVIVEQEGHILGPDGLARAIGSERPLTELTFLMDAGRHGMDPRGWHWTNLLLHLASTLVLFELIRRCVRHVVAGGMQSIGTDRISIFVAFVASLVWSLHPVHAEVVSYVVQRSESLAALFCLLSMLCLVLAFEGGRNLRWAVVLSVLVVLGLASKATAICVAPLLLVLDWGVLAGSLRVALRRRWLLHLVAWSLVLAYALGHVIFGGLLDATPDRAVGVGLGVRGQTPLTYALAQVEGIPVYLGLVFAPIELLIDRPDQAGRWSVALLPGVLFILCWVGLGGFGLLRGKWWGAVMLMAVLVMLPTSSFIPISDVIVEHRLHLTLAPFAVLFAGGLAWFIMFSSGRGFRPAWVPSGLVVLLVLTIVSLEMTRTHARNLDYASPARLWMQVMESDTGNTRGRVNYSSELLRQGRHLDALPIIESIIEVDPGNLEARVNAGIALIALDRPVEALEHLRIAENSFSGHPSMHAALGDAERALGNLEAAEQHFKRVVDRQPSDARTHLVLGNLFQEQGRVEESLHHQDLAVALLRGGRDRELLYSALLNRGSSAFRLERWSEAAEYYEDAMESASSEEQRQRIAPYLDASRNRSLEPSPGDQQDDD